ncbi:uncharacterized protein SOCEGT47_009550 [Sorangium cellulosum]|uniref:Uncharacterized protein n=1 Tax=Sorangium cellulosum TaxID=56 RepID=A0A4P2PVK2_SORCE|nr:uncharacterized protein SOCEGT47_009550 [Sorangium cellulosum]
MWNVGLELGAPPVPAAPPPDPVTPVEAPPVPALVLPVEAPPVPALVLPVEAPPVPALVLPVEAPPVPALVLPVEAPPVPALVLPVEGPPVPGPAPPVLPTSPVEPGEEDSPHPDAAMMARNGKRRNLAVPRSVRFIWVMVIASSRRGAIRTEGRNWWAGGAMPAGRTSPAKSSAPRHNLSQLGSLASRIRPGATRGEGRHRWILPSSTAARPSVRRERRPVLSRRSGFTVRDRGYLKRARRAGNAGDSTRGKRAASRNRRAARCAWLLVSPSALAGSRSRGSRWSEPHTTLASDAAEAAAAAQPRAPATSCAARRTSAAAAPTLHARASHHCTSAPLIHGGTHAGGAARSAAVRTRSRSGAAR